VSFTILRSERITRLSCVLNNTYCCLHDPFVCKIKIVIVRSTMFSLKKKCYLYEIDNNIVYVLSCLFISMYLLYRIINYSINNRSTKKKVPQVKIISSIVFFILAFILKENSCRCHGYKKCIKFTLLLLLLLLLFNS